MGAHPCHWEEDAQQLFSHGNILNFIEIIYGMEKVHSL